MRGCVAALLAANISSRFFRVAALKAANLFLHRIIQIHLWKLERHQPRSGSQYLPTQVFALVATCL